MTDHDKIAKDLLRVAVLHDRSFPSDRRDKMVRECLSLPLDLLGIPPDRECSREPFWNEWRRLVDGGLTQEQVIDEFIKAVLCNARMAIF